ncbi:MAG: hypothetical protein ABI741_10990 [Ferruginibacter sp.]
MKKMIVVMVLALLCHDCTAQKKRLMKGTTVYVYSLSTGAVPQPLYTKYKVKKSIKLAIVDNGSYMIVKGDLAKNPKNFEVVKKDIVITGNVPAWKHESKGTAYFYESEDDNKAKFWYRDGKVILQAVSIPLKIRSEVKASGTYSTIPSTTETSVNIGFMGGYKFGWNKYRKDNNLFGQQTTKYSITPGIFLGTSAADLSTTLTRPVITTARKAAMISSGGSVVLGFNSFNIGYAFGWDHAIGSSASSWVYQGKFWNGIIVSLDLIK